MNSIFHSIVIRELQKKASQRTILDVKELHVEFGKFVLFRGENGAGKSTLLKVLAGLVVPDSAQILINGEQNTVRQAARAFRRQTVYLHQSPYLFDRSVIENVSYGLLVRGISRKNTMAKVEDALEWAGLAPLAHRNARDLSGGEKQRVALTRARILNPEILLLDEPTTGMDQSAREQTFELIKNLKNDGITIYVASHELDQSVGCDTTVVIEQGRIVDHNA